jgi:intergrase/recombinase
MYTSKISLQVHDDNYESTDPNLFFLKSGECTNQEKRLLWEKSIKNNPISFSARFLIELPEPVDKVIENDRQADNGREAVVILITMSNMRKLLSENVSLLVEWVTSK